MTEARDFQFSRRGFLAAAGATAAAAGVIVSTSGSGAGAATLGAKAKAAVPAGLLDRAPSQSAADDLKIAAFAASLEVVAVAAYQKVADAAASGALGAVPPAGGEYVMTAIAQHTAQLQKWNDVLTGAGQPAVTTGDATLQGVVDQRVPGVTDFALAAMLAHDLEVIAAATYQSAIPKLSGMDAIQLAGSIQIIDAQHVAILNYVLGQYPVPDTFAKVDKAATPPAS